MSWSMEGAILANMRNSGEHEALDPLMTFISPAKIAIIGSRFRVFCYTSKASHLHFDYLQRRFE